MNNLLISGSEDNTLRLWDLKDFECKSVIQMDFGEFILLQVDEQYVYTYSPKKGIVVWSWKTRKFITNIKCDLGEDQYSLAVDKIHIYCCPYYPDKNYVEGGIGIFSKQDWKLHKFIPLKQKRNNLGECSRIIIEGDRLFADCLLELYEINLNTYEIVDHWCPIEADIYDYSLDSEYLYFGPFVFSRQTRKQIGKLYEKNCFECHFVVNDKNIVYLRNTGLPYANIWQKGLWKLCQTLRVPKSNGSAESLTVSDKYVCLGSSNEINVWSKTNWECLHVLKGHSGLVRNLIFF